MGNSILKENKSVINSVIGCALIFLVWHLPPIGAITSTGMQVLGIFIGGVYLWTTVSTLWPSLLIIALLMVTDIGSSAAILTASFGNQVVVMMIFILAFCGAIEDAKIYDYIARWILSLKIMNGRPWIFTAVMCFGIYFLGILSWIPMTFFFWTMLYTAFDMLGMPRDCKYAKLMYFAIPSIAFLGSFVLPFQGMALILTGTVNAIIPGSTLNNGVYFLIINAINLTVVLLWILAMKFIFRPDVTSLKQISSNLFNLNPLPPMSSVQKFLMVYFFGTLLLLFAPSFLPAQWALTVLLKKLGSVGILFVMLSPLFLIRREGKPVADFMSLAGSKIVWSLVFLCAAAMVLSSLLTNEATGINKLMSSLLGALFAGKSEFVFIAIICAITLFLTNLTNNGVVAILIVTVSCMFIGNYDLNPMSLVVLVAFTADIGYLLPASSMAGAVIYGNPYLKATDIYIYAITIVVICFIAAIGVGYPLCVLFI